jgi:hypothetical protein
MSDPFQEEIAPHGTRGASKHLWEVGCKTVQSKGSQEQ